jgi:hypothetical protein
VVLVIAVVLGITIVLATEYGLQGEDYSGCYVYDAMLVGFECTGFPGASVVSLLANLPLLMLFSPLFMMFNLKSALVAVSLWAFPIMFVVSSNKVKKLNA